MTAEVADCGVAPTVAGTAGFDAAAETTGVATADVAGAAVTGAVTAAAGCTATGFAAVAGTADVDVDAAAATGAAAAATGAAAAGWDGTAGAVGLAAAAGVTDAAADVTADATELPVLSRRGGWLGRGDRSRSQRRGRRRRCVGLPGKHQQEHHSPGSQNCDLHRSASDMPQCRLGHEQLPSGREGQT